MSEEPEILDQSAIADDEQSLARRGPVDLMQVPRLLGGALSDIRAIAEGMAVLPKLLVTLGDIRGEVETLSEEVTRMRAAVEGMGGDVGELRGGMDRLEPHLEDVSRITHPIRHLSRRRTGG
jgi:hypothetical protein